MAADQSQPSASGAQRMTSPHNISLLPADVGGTLFTRIAHCQAMLWPSSASQAPAVIDCAAMTA
jgi:hypothetical protein